MQKAVEAAADIFIGWLNVRLGSQYTLSQSGDDFLACETAKEGAGDDAGRMAVSVYPLFDADGDPGWARRRDAVAEQLRQRSAVPLTLWVPPETDLPTGDRTEFNRRVVEAASTLPPGGRGQVEFPVTLTLKKQSDEASYVHVIGGLAPLWARLTGRAYGQYLLDATAIHRLPEPEQRVADLLEWVALLGNGMKSGTTSEIKAEDAWTVTRPTQGDAVTLVAAPPTTDPANGTSVRKALRAGLRAACERAPSRPGRRAVVFLGVFRTIEEENATIALRSCDPALHAPFDTVCLVADGACKPLVAPRWT